MAKMSNRRMYFEQFSRFTGVWEAGDMCEAPCKAPGYCCYALCCPHCASYQLRVRALHNNMAAYRCCGGYHPCTGRCGEEGCPECCLCMEVCCCFPASVMSTRHMLQDEMQVGNLPCDNALITFVVACEWTACILGIVDPQLGDLAHNVADAVYTSTCACMQTQHKVQLDARDEGKVPTFTTTVMVTMNPPQAQQMVMMAPQQQVVMAPQQPQYYGQPGQPMMVAPVAQPVGGYYVQPSGQPMAMAPVAQPGMVYANPMVVQPQAMGK